MYLGMTARLWNGRFDTFDIEDMRTENVVRAWLPETMHAHLVNVETLPPSDVAVDVVQSADFLFIDGGHKVEFLLLLLATYFVTFIIF